MWDLLAVAGVVAPFAGIASPALGAPDGSIVRWGRWSALAAAAAFVVLAAVGAAPSLGDFAPDRLALAASAGALLIATALATEPPAGRGSLAARLAAPAGGVVALCSGLAGTGAGLGRNEAAALLVVGGVAAAVLAVAGGSPGDRRLAAVFQPAALLVAFRGAAALPPGRPIAPVVIALAVLGAALALVGLTGRPWAFRPPPAAAIGAWAAVVAAAPLVGARPAGVVLGAAAVLTLALPGRRWPLLATLPGTAAVATALADVPTGAPAPWPPTHVTLAVLAAFTVAALTVAARRGPAPGQAPAADAAHVPSAEAVAAVAVLTTWIALAPGAWSFGHAAAFAAWDEGAAIAAAAGLAAGTAWLARDRLGNGPAR